MFYDVFNSKIGNIFIIFDEKGFLTGVSTKKDDVKNLKKNLKFAQKILTELQKYFNNELQKFNIKFKLTGTEFQNCVWNEIAKIPYGKTISYKELAQKINNPKAIRAVASACKANHIPIIIPCHRVISTDGSLGGFSFNGIETKKFLIELEK